MNGHHIKKIAAEWKAQNGNPSLSQKDMIIYIMNRLDNLPCDAHLALMVEATNSIKHWRWFAGIIIGLFATAIAGLYGIVISL